MTDAVTSRTAAVEPLAPLAPEAVLTTLEALAPQARPYNFDDRFDCWGLVREVYGRLLSGRPLDDDLDTATAVELSRVERWAPITTLADLLPGDVVTTHDHHEPGKFHAVIVYGWLDGRLLVCDSHRAATSLWSRIARAATRWSTRASCTRVTCGRRGAPTGCATTAAPTCGSGSSVAATSTGGCTKRCCRRTRNARPTPSRYAVARGLRRCRSTSRTGCPPTAPVASSTTTAPRAPRTPTCRTARPCLTTTIRRPVVPPAPVGDRRRRSSSQRRPPLTRVARHA